MMSSLCEILFIIYILMILLFILYLIIAEYYNVRVRATIAANTTTTSIPILDEQLKRIDCKQQRTFCTADSDCAQLCTRSVDDEMLQIEYKCNDINTCTQSVRTSSGENNQHQSIKCNRLFGFIPTLTADEIFQPYWICLNTRPHIFDSSTQDYHPYICAGGNRTQLNPSNLYNSCVCPETKIKVRDEFRDGIPLCVSRNQLSLFPNFTPGN